MVQKTKIELISAICWMIYRVVPLGFGDLLVKYFGLVPCIHYHVETRKAFKFHIKRIGTV